MHCSSPSRTGTSACLQRGHRRLGQGEVAAPGATGRFIAGVGAPRERGAEVAVIPTADRNRFSITAGMRTYRLDVSGAEVTGTVVGRHKAGSVTEAADPA